MARHYVLGSWANADEFDYSGEQLMGSRHGKSICMDHMLPNGMANLKRYGDPVQPQKKVKPKKSVADSIDLAQRHFDRIEQMSIDLDAEYFAGEIDDERYELLRYKADQRLLAAWKRLERENTPIWQKQDEKYAKSSLTFSLDEVTFESKRKSHKSLGKTVDKTMIAGEGWQWQALRDCKENNLILVGICSIFKFIKKIKTLGIK